MASVKQQVEELRRTVEQCKRELRVQRMSLSQCGSDLINYVEKHMKEDPFINKIPANENPFREKKSVCEIL